MNGSSRFTVMVHILAVLALYKSRFGEETLSSRFIAGSVNTNPVVIRRALTELNKAGLVVSQHGADGGAQIARRPEHISLMEVYHIVERRPLFALHHNPPNPICPCGRHIQPVLTHVYQEVDKAVETVLVGKTIADIVRQMEDRLDSEPG